MCSDNCDTTATTTDGGRWRRAARRAGQYFTVLLFVLLTCALGADWFISVQTQTLVVNRIEAVPATPVALVLGTTRWHQGRPNQFYWARIAMAAALYHSGRVQGILVSGDNASIYYNEPQFMRRDLRKLGVPDAAITLDYAGFRTLDSVIRAKQVFGLERVIIISQRFHVERALFIAQHSGLAAIGLAAPDPTAPGVMTVRIREVPARMMAIWDVLTQRAPRFLGQRELVKLYPANTVINAPAAPN